MLVEGTVAGQALPAEIAGQVCPAAVADEILPAVDGVVGVVQVLPAPVAEQVFPAAVVETARADSTDAGRSGEASVIADGSGAAVEAVEVDSADETLFDVQTQEWLRQATLTDPTSADEEMATTDPRIPGIWLERVYSGARGELPSSWETW